MLINQEWNYFDYLRLAKREYDSLMVKYPELARLSGRELEVFEQLLTDKTQMGIGEVLAISHSAVHFHCKNIYRKLNISSRKQLLVRYKYL